MKIAVLGATGWVGSAIVEQAKRRGHDVVSIVRDKNKLATIDSSVREFDLNNGSAFTDIVLDVDVLIVAIGGRAKGNHEIVVNTASHLLKALNKSKTRLLWVGGAGSLEVAPGVTLLSTPDFPAEYKDEAVAQGEALALFRQTPFSVNWTYVSPAAVLYPGESENAYRIGGDAFFTNNKGESKISVTDYAIAMVDEAELARYPQKRISIAY
jgi:uncharacterized protein